jgi:hypothetical protein
VSRTIGRRKWRCGSCHPRAPLDLRHPRLEEEQRRHPIGMAGGEDLRDQGATRVADEHGRPCEAERVQERRELFGLLVATMRAGAAEARAGPVIGKRGDERRDPALQRVPLLQARRQAVDEDDRRAGLVHALQSVADARAANLGEGLGGGDGPFVLGFEPLFDERGAREQACDDERRREKAVALHPCGWRARSCAADSMSRSCTRTCSAAGPSGM